MPDRTDYVVIAACAAAVLLGTVVLGSYPAAVSEDWALALLILVLLSLLGALLSFRVTAGGSATSLEFLPELGALLLLGPVGALTQSVLSSLTTQQFVYRRAPRKVAFNVAQSVLAIGLASIVYLALGGEPSLTRLEFSQAFPPFLGASVTYFATNSLAVTTVIALSEEETFGKVWTRVAGKSILLDILTSPLAYLVAYLYVRWGALALVFAVVPIIGLRYSYGVNIQLQQLNRDLLRVLVKTLEAQDPYTSGHSIRVSERAKIIAEQLSLGSKKTRIIETAALLHDIGKIGSEFSRILRQKGPLTDEQRLLIRSHPDRGVDIIRSVRALDPQVLACVKHHHERFDGTGYPDKLAGEQIPLGSRIISVCDTIDAMLTARPYREALSVSIVRDELLKYAGSQFDPRIVKAVMTTGLLGEDQLDFTTKTPQVEDAESVAESRRAELA